MKRFSRLLLTFSAALASACGGSSGPVLSDFTTEIYTPAYASGFDIRGNGNNASTLVSIRNPWQGGTNVEQHLLILRDDAKAPADFAGQVDVAPTLLGMLGIGYTQNNFGVDLTRERRPAMFYTADNTVAARDSSHLYVFNPTVGQEFCYDTSAGTPVAVEMSDPYRRLKDYCFSMLQATEQLVQEGRTVDHRK